MISLIFRNIGESQSNQELLRENKEAPVYMQLTKENNIIVDKCNENYLSIESQGERHYLDTDINGVYIKGKQLVLTKNKLEKLQSAVHDIEVFMETVINSFKKQITIKVEVDKEVKYIDEIITCFNNLIELHKQRNAMDVWNERVKNVKKEEYEGFYKTITADLEFEDYDRTGSIYEMRLALERKRRNLINKKVMFLNIAPDERMDQQSINRIIELLADLNEKNSTVRILKNKLAKNIEDQKDINELPTLDSIARFFKKLLIDDKLNRTLSHGDFIYAGNTEIEVSNILDPDKSNQWNRAFDPDMTYNNVDEILDQVKKSEFIHKSKINYIHQRYGDNYSDKERKQQENELNDEIIKNLPMIRNLIRFDCKILNFEKGKIICSKGDFGNSAFFIVKGTVGIVLHDNRSGHDEKSHKQVKKKSFYRAFAQLFSNKHHIHEYRSKVGHKHTEADPSVFVQDFDTIIQSSHLKFVTTQSAGNMFGEISAMGRTPRTATVIATEPVVLLEIRWQGLRDLRENLPIIKEITDANFRERGLDVHIRESPIFKAVNLSDQKRKDLEKKCMFHSYGDFKWNMSYKDLARKGETNDLSTEPIIISEGDYPDCLYLIRSGFARVSHRFNNGHLTINYLGKGAHFGLDELRHNYENPHDQKNHRFSLRAIGYLDAIKVPKDQVINYIFENDPKSKALHDENIMKMVDFSIQPDIDRSHSYIKTKNTIDQGLIESLVGGRIVNGTQTMLINMDRCTRCDDCVVACANAHDGNPRFIRHGLSIDNYMVANACMHCNDPVCMIGCPTGAIIRNTEGGQVLINDTTCIGCSTCANSCPYDNIRMVEYVEQGSDTFKKDLKTGQPLQKATKCDLCVDQLGGPACQRACPHDALKRVDLSDIKKVEDWLGIYKITSL